MDIHIFFLIESDIKFCCNSAETFFSDILQKINNTMRIFCPEVWKGFRISRLMFYALQDIRIGKKADVLSFWNYTVESGSHSKASQTRQNPFETIFDRKTNDPQFIS